MWAGRTASSRRTPVPAASASGPLGRQSRRGRAAATGGPVISRLQSRGRPVQRFRLSATSRRAAGTGLVGEDFLQGGVFGQEQAGVDEHADVPSGFGEQAFPFG